MKRSFKILRRSCLALLPGLLVGLAACDEDTSGPLPEYNSGQDIAAIAAAASDLTTLNAALAAAGLTAALQGDGPFTVFAPRDAAFDDLGGDVIAALLEQDNADLLSEVLTFHVVSGIAAAAGDLTDGQMVTTLQGSELTIGVSGGAVTVNGANVVTADIKAINGVIHLIDAVLVPEVDLVDMLILNDEAQTAVAAVSAGDLVSTLRGPGPFTVFAPVDAAFEELGSYTLEALLDPANQALLQKVLTYHVISGDIRAADLTDGAMVATVEGTEVTIDLSDPMMPKVNGANIIATDIVVENGVIHLVDGVLLPELDIIEKATITDGVGTLTAAVVAGDLVTTLQGPGPFTVFAPVDAAFE
ncbi:MAG: fasciclin domain-containing protein, partial [Longimicrobiales bacterium]